MMDLTDEQKEYVSSITMANNSGHHSVVIEENLLTEKMKEYLSIHRHRTHPELN